MLRSLVWDFVFGLRLAMGLGLIGSQSRQRCSVVTLPQVHLYFHFHCPDVLQSDVYPGLLEPAFLQLYQVHPLVALRLYWIQSQLAQHYRD